MEKSETKEIFQAIRGTPCLVCGSLPSDVAHIRSRGAGGGNKEWNLMPLCRPHHSRQHFIGWKRFSSENERVFDYLSEMGWYFDKNNKLKRDISDN